MSGYHFYKKKRKKKKQNNQAMSGIELLPLPRKAKTFLLPLTNKDDHQL